MRKLSAAVLTAVMLGMSPALADPVGQYVVEGVNPGGSGKYSGSVNVERTGETYRVTWVIGSDRYVGTGIGNKDFLSVSYKSGDSTGLALYGADGNGWTGVWAYSGGVKMGAERWLRK